jgi:hypothetical protein
MLNVHMQLMTRSEITDLKLRCKAIRVVLFPASKAYHIYFLLGFTSILVQHCFKKFVIVALFVFAKKVTILSF